MKSNEHSPQPQNPEKRANTYYHTVREQHLRDYATLRKLDETLEWFWQKYDITVDFAHENCTEPLDEETLEIKSGNLDRYLDTAQILQREFSKWPPSLLRKLKLKKIILCDGLTDTLRGERRELSGLAVGTPQGDTIYLAEVHCIWHEIFHIIDVQTGGLFFGIPQTTAVKQNSQWQGYAWPPRREDFLLDPNQLGYIDEEQAQYMSYTMNLDNIPEWSKHNFNYTRHHIREKNENPPCRMVGRNFR